MRSLPTCLLVLLVLCGAPAGAVPPSVQKRMERRVETEEVVKRVLEGTSVPAATSRLKYLGEKPYAAELLIRSISRLVEPRQIRDVTAVLSALSVRGAEPTLVRLCAHGDGPVRMYAVQGLGRLRSGQVDVMRALLQDKTSGVRREAARALGASRNRKVGKALVEAAKGETDLEVRTAMLEAAGASGDAKLAPALESFLKSDSESTRFAAARGLCLLGSPKGFAHAQKLLASEDRYVRRQGVALYEGVSAKKASASLRPLLGDKDTAVAAAAARILYQGGDKNMLDWLVIASSHAKGDEKLAYEKELEGLHLTDAQRMAILRKAGVRK